MKGEFIRAVVVGVVSKVLADEAKDWTIWLPPKLIRFAARQFPPSSQSRIEEEWLAHCNDIPGNLSKLCHALGCVAAAVKVTDTPSRKFLILLISPAVELASIGAVPVFLAFRVLTSVFVACLQPNESYLVSLGLGRQPELGAPICDDDKHKRYRSSRLSRFTNNLDNFEKFVRHSSLFGEVLFYCLDESAERYVGLCRRFFPKLMRKPMRRVSIN